MSLVKKIQDLASEEIDTIVDLLTEQELYEAREIFWHENGEKAVTNHQAVDFILNAL